MEQRLNLKQTKTFLFQNAQSMTSQRTAPLEDRKQVFILIREIVSLTKANPVYLL